MGEEMRKQARWRLWPFLNFMEIPAYLARMEQKGLRFEGLCINGFLAKYRRVEPAEAYYCWDYLESRRIGEIEPYLELCRAGGWEIVWQFQMNKVFRYEGEGEPTPLQTDEELWNENRKRAAKKAYRGVFFMALFLAVIWGWLFWFLDDDFRRQFASATLYEQLLVPLGGLAIGGPLLWCGYWWLRLGTGWMKPRPGLELSAAGGAARALLKPVSIVLALVLIYCMLDDWVSPWRELAVLELILILWAPMGGAGSYWEKEEGLPKYYQMKGTPKYGRLSRVLAGAVMIGWAALIFVNGFVADSLKWDERPVQTFSLYCSEIYKETSLSICNRYYRVRNERDTDKVSWSLRNEWDDKSQNMRRFAPGEAAELRGQLPDWECLEIIESGDWDEAWLYGAAYDPFCLVRRGQELWQITILDHEDDEKKAEQFLIDTNF